VDSNNLPQDREKRKALVKDIKNTEFHKMLYIFFWLKTSQFDKKNSARGVSYEYCKNHSLDKSL